MGTCSGVKPTKPSGIHCFSQSKQQFQWLISPNSSLNMRMGTFRLRDLLSNKALTDTSVRAPSGPLCSTLMTCHSCRTTRKPSKLKLWPTAKEALCTLETLMAVSEYTAYQSFLKCRNHGRTTWERGPGKGRERVRNEERTERQKWKCKTTGLSCPQGQLRVKKKGIYMLSVEGF